MRTQSGRRSYCFKADRFIYCPNNHVEPGRSPHHAVLNCAPLKLTWHHAFLSRVHVVIQDFTSVVIHSTEHRCATITSRNV